MVEVASHRNGQSKCPSEEYFLLLHFKYISEALLHYFYLNEDESLLVLLPVFLYKSICICTWVWNMSTFATSACGCDSVAISLSISVVHFWVIVGYQIVHTCLAKIKLKCLEYECWWCHFKRESTLKFGTECCLPLGCITF